MDPGSALPPSYSAATGQHSSFGGGLSFVDFIPQCVDPGSLLTRPVFEPFNVLADRANGWLQQTPSWEAKTCESVEFKVRYNELNFEQMSYIEHANMATFFVRGLRLWIVPRSDPTRPPQQIGYINVVPQEVQGGGLETLNLVLDRLNRELLANPLPGRILTVETQEMKLPSMKELDPNVSLFVNKGFLWNRFIFVLRIFYEVSEPANEVIGIAGFMPALLKEGALFSPPVYEPFPNVIGKAFQWCAEQQGMRFCNAQSVEIMMEIGGIVDPQLMAYFEYRERSTHFVRILRIAYTKTLANPTPSSAPVLNLTCKTFVPVQIAVGTFGNPTYETATQTRERISAWVKATGAKVVSAETCAVRIFGFYGTAGPDTSFTYTSNKRGAFWMFAIRLYLDGLYPEPPAEVLPPLPPIVNKGSCIVL